MKQLFKNFTAGKGYFRLRTEIPSKDDGLVEGSNENPGGFKLMTVFIVVLALHVLVIGGITAYHLCKGAPKDIAENTTGAVTPATADALTTDGTSTDKADGTTPDSNTPSIETNGTPATPAPAPSMANAPVTTPALIAEATPAPAPIQAPAPAPVKVATIAAKPAPAVAMTTTPATSVSYVVKGGDNLHKIALSHGMTVAQLKAMNGLKNDTIRVGQKLAVKGTATGTTSIAKASAPAASSATVASTPAASTSGRSYQVAKGDTLTHIAKLFSTSPAAIMAANKLSDPKKLKIGEKLLIPAKAQADQRQVTEQQATPATVPNQSQATPDLVMNK